MMLETFPGSMLATWRLESWPVEQVMQATRLRDHRRLYLEFEGELTGQRGSVYRLAEGSCRVEVGENAVWTVAFETGIAPQTLVLRQLEGERWAIEPGPVPSR
jgi:hypothetical protein